MRVRWIAVAAVLLAAGCGSAEPASSSLTVLAAASLTESFDTIGPLFEAKNPGVKVTFSYGGSSGLAQQITSGAPADVFAAASPATMKTVTDAGAATGTPVTFVRNQLVIAVAKGNPDGIASLAALAKPGVKVALCAEQVPCGAAATKALAAANVKVTPVTQEQDVKSALSKVKLGEVDAALVYRTDARAAASDVDGVEFPESAGAINDYPIAALKDAPNPSAAQAFVAFVQTPEAQQVLTDAGFQKP
ncbi:molybdate ABC transporter substrate-binding protein [Actinoplanes sp. RD1]|uniref:molybdate ABC transporter substrate-binding protein n=1 Tax=Actinoplanes sp. RD1 TaxID=3064538 RepID=UPI002740C8AB|nr:molybdate ABC transporter substrate-binding protein [Actinoplanes sp. RD1]